MTGSSPARAITGAQWNEKSGDATEHRCNILQFMITVDDYDNNDDGAFATLERGP